MTIESAEKLAKILLPCKEMHVCYINKYTNEYVSMKINSLFVNRMIKDLENQGSLVSMFSDNYWKGDEWTEKYLRKQLKE